MTPTSEVIASGTIGSYRYTLQRLTDEDGDVTYYIEGRYLGSGFSPVPPPVEATFEDRPVAVQMFCTLLGRLAP